MAGGDFKLDFAAAAPWTYDHLTGGGSWDDKTIGRGLDVVESLQGGDFKSGDIVSYFLEIDVNSTAIERNQAIQVKVGFLASTTGQPGVGHDWIQNIQVNYTSERVDYTQTPPPSGSLGGLNNRRIVTDAANTGSRNDGGSYVEFVEQGFETKDGVVKQGISGNATSTSLGPLANVDYSNNDDETNPTRWLYDEQMTRLYAVFNVYDLDPGEKPVVRIDVHLGDDGKAPTGNLQAFLLDAQVISDTAGTTTINTGRQTIPFKLTKDIDRGVQNYGIGLEKYVTTDITTDLSGFNTLAQFENYLNVNRSKQVDVISGTTVRYIYKITNNGAGALNNIRLYHDNSIAGGGITKAFVGDVTEAASGQTPQTTYRGVLFDGSFNPVNYSPSTVYASNNSPRNKGNLDAQHTDDIALILPGTGNSAVDINGDGDKDFLLGSGVVRVFGFTSTASTGNAAAVADNDLAAGAVAYVVYEYTATGTVNSVISSEALVVGYDDINGGDQQGVQYGGISDAGVRIVSTLPTRLGSISGKVYVDLDNDFDRDANETGLAGYRIELLNAGGTVIASKVTNASGRYFFDNLTAGTYSVRQVTSSTDPTGVTQENVGYVANVLRGTNSDNDTLRKDETPDTVSRIDGIVLGNGQNGRNYDFGVRNSDQSGLGSISGRVFQDNNNNGVIDPGESLLNRVLLELRNSSNQVVATTHTDNQGNYSFLGLADGAYSVTQVDPQYFDPYLERLVPYVGDTQKKGSDAEVTTNNLNRIDGLTIGAGSKSLTENNFGEVPPVSLSGYVYWDRPFTEGGVTYNPDNNFDTMAPSRDVGIAGVTLQLTGTADDGTPVNLTTITDANGFYYFAGLRPSNSTGYTITQIEPDGTILDSEDTTDNAGVNVGVIDTMENANYGVASVVSGSNGNDTISGIKITQFGVGGTEYNFAELSDAPSLGSISGNVKADTTGDTIGENNLAGVTVELRVGSTVIATTTTGTDGNYSFTNLAPGSYSVRQVNLPSYIDVIDTQGANDSLISVTLATVGASSPGNNFVDRLVLGSIAGRVLDDRFGERTGQIDTVQSVFNDKGIEGVQIKLTNAGADGRFLTADDIVRFTTTNSDGEYSFGDLYPGLYRVESADLPGYTSVLDVDNGNPNFINNIQISSNSVTERNFLDRSDPGTISGFVFDNRFGNDQNTFDPGDQPIEGVSVELRGAGADGVFGTLENPGDDIIRSITTGADGSYSFTDLAPGLYQITQVDLPSYTSVTDVDETLTNNTVNFIGNITLGLGQTVAGQNFLDTSPVPTPLEGQEPENPSVLLTKSFVSAKAPEGSNGGQDNTVDVSGETITYTITLQNTGNVALTPTVTDPMLGGALSGQVETITVDGQASGNPGTLDVGETWTYTVTVDANKLVLGAYGNALSQMEALLPSKTRFILNRAGEDFNIYSRLGGLQDSYFDGFAYDPTSTGQTILNGWNNVWCVDAERTAWTNAIFTADVYSTYNPIIYDPTPGTIFDPLGPGSINVDKPYNLDLVNWVLNQGFIGTSAGTGLGNYSSGDVQYAIWSLIDNQPITVDLVDFDAIRANQIVQAAFAFEAAQDVTSYEIAYTPGFGDKLAVLVIPLNARGNYSGRQKLIVEVDLPTIGLLTNTATVEYTYDGQIITQSDSATTTVDLPPLTITETFNSVNLVGDKYADRLIAGNANDTLNGLAGRDILTGGGGADTFLVQFGHSLVNGTDWITDFEIGSDKIGLRTFSTTTGAGMNVPVAFTRAANATVDRINTTNLTAVVNSVFADADGALAGNQALDINSAALVQITATIPNTTHTYLVINDGTAGFQSTTDSIVDITGYSGILPGFGAITPTNFFASSL